MEQILQKTLRDNEKVLWFGRPTKTKLLRSPDRVSQYVAWIITAVMTTLSIFSPNLSIRKLSNLPGASSSSSSSKKLADQVRVFIPRIIESAKLKIPRTNGREKIFTFSVILTYVSFWITISPSGFLTAVA